MNSDAIEIGKRVSQMRSEYLKLNKSQFAAALNKTGWNGSHTYIVRYEAGEYKPKSDFYAAFDKAFPDFSAEWIRTGEGTILKINKGMEVSDYNEFYHRSKEVRVYTKVDAGLPAETWANNESELMIGHITMEKIKEKLYGFQVKGNSMEAKFSDGDYLITTEIKLGHALPNNGDFVVVFFKSGQDTSKALLKQFKWADKKAKSFMLISLNREYEPTFHKINEVAKMFRVQTSYSIHNKNLL